jgi:hypothetical protein
LGGFSLGMLVLDCSVPMKEQEYGRTSRIQRGTRLPESRKMEMVLLLD